jgi:hypothetical protein
LQAPIYILASEYQESSEEASLPGSFEPAQSLLQAYATPPRKNDAAEGGAAPAKRIGPF